ncbi:MAG: hypothetical protein ACODAE_10940, partial [Gemmatimonadota bacterium]
DAPRLGWLGRTVLRIAKLAGMDEDEALAKFAAMGAVDFEDVEAERRLPAVHEEIEEKIGSLAAALHRTLEAEEGDREATLREAAEQFAALVEDAAPRWAVGETVEKADADGPHEDAPNEESDMPEQTTDKRLDIDALPEEHREAVRAEVERLEKRVSELEDAGGAEDGDEITRLEKRVDALEDAGETETAAVVKETLAAAKAARERADATEERLSAMEARRERERFVTKAASLTHLPNWSADDIGPVLQKVAAALSEDEFEALEKALRAADGALAEAALYAEVGSGGGGAASVDEKVEARAAELRKADPSLSREKAIAKVYDENPGLYDEQLRSE